MDNFDQTEFNSNLATLERIDQLLRKCAIASYENDYASWFQLLKNLRREVVIKLKKKDKPEEESDMWEQLKKDYVMYRKHSMDFNLNRDFSDRLDDYEIWLRNIMNLKGMLLKDAEDLRGL